MRDAYCGFLLCPPDRTDSRGTVSRGWTPCPLRGVEGTHYILYIVSLGRLRREMLNFRCVGLAIRLLIRIFAL